jgi:hypothetical protein
MTQNVPLFRSAKFMRCALVPELSYYRTHTLRLALKNDTHLARISQRFFDNPCGVHC